MALREDGKSSKDMRVMDVSATCLVDSSIWITDVHRGDLGL